MWVRSENDINRVVLEWKPTVKRPRGRPRKRWLEVVEGELEQNESSRIEKTIPRYREKWRDLVIVVNTLTEY